MGECGIKITPDTLLTPNPKDYEQSIKEIAECLDLDFDKALYLTQTIKFFTHGLASSIATNTFTESKENIYFLLFNTMYLLLISLGIPKETAKTLSFNPLDT